MGLSAHNFCVCCGQSSEFASQTSCGTCIRKSYSLNVKLSSRTICTHYIVGNTAAPDRKMFLSFILALGVIGCTQKTLYTSRLVAELASTRVIRLSFSNRPIFSKKYSSKYHFRPYPTKTSPPSSIAIVPVTLIGLFGVDSLLTQTTANSSSSSRIM